MKKAIKSIFVGIVDKQGVFHERIVNIIFEYIAAFEVIQNFMNPFHFTLDRSVVVERRGWAKNCGIWPSFQLLRGSIKC